MVGAARGVGVVAVLGRFLLAVVVGVGVVLRLVVAVRVDAEVERASRGQRGRDRAAA